MRRWFHELLYPGGEAESYKGGAQDRITGALVFIASAAICFTLTASSSFPGGTDGYVYAIQLKSLVGKSRMHFPDPSLIYPFLMLVKLFVRDYIMALKAATALLSGMFALCVYSLSLSLSGRRSVSVLFAAAAALSPSIHFLAVQFPKNFMGVVFFMAFLNAMQRKKPLLSILFIALAIVTHRLTAGLLGIYLATGMLFIRNKRLLASGAVAALIAAAVFSTLMPGALHLYDLARFSGFLSFVPQAAPLSFTSLLGEHHFPWSWRFELYVLYALVWISVIRTIVSGIKKIPLPVPFYALSATAAALVFPFSRFDISGMAYRFYLASVPVAMALLIYNVQATAWNRLAYNSAAKHTEFAERAGGKRHITGVAVAGSMAVLGLVSMLTVDFIPFDPPYAYYTNIARSVETAVRDRGARLLVVHKPLAELIDYETGREVLPWKPEESFDRTKVWRLAVNVEDWEITAGAAAHGGHPGEGLIVPVSAVYILVREDLWERFVASVKADENEDLYRRVYSPYNPYIERPRYLLRGRNNL